MTELIYYVASSLDGHIASAGGGLEWLAPFEASAEDYGYAAFYESIEAVLLGSRTYEQALTFGDWPYPGKPTWVFSARRLDPIRDDVIVTDRMPVSIMPSWRNAAFAVRGLSAEGRLPGHFEQMDSSRSTSCRSSR